LNDVLYRANGYYRYFVHESHNFKKEDADLKSKDLRQQNQTLYQACAGLLQQNNPVHQGCATTASTNDLHESFCCLPASVINGDDLSCCIAVFISHDNNSNGNDACSVSKGHCLAGALLHP
jgi:hypothetical protein